MASDEILAGGSIDRIAAPILSWVGRPETLCSVIIRGINLRLTTGPAVMKQRRPHPSDSIRLAGSHVSCVTGSSDVAARCGSSYLMPIRTPLIRTTREGGPLRVAQFGQSSDEG